jgi:diketogulonate reductase-like aldo/keto reductase
LEASKLGIHDGFCHIDAAYFHQNEEEVGLAIQNKIADGTVKRDDIFHTSKLLLILCAGVQINEM